MRTKIRLIILLFAFSATSSFAGKIEKGFEALDIYNYFAAKELFEKAMKRDTVAASYGLSIIYSRNDNPFYDLEAARKAVVKAVNNYAQLPDKKKEKYEEIGIDYDRIVEHRKLISEALYKQVKEIHEVEAYNTFIKNNSWSPLVDSVIIFRDNLAFEEVKEIGTAEAFTSFIQTYPKTALMERAVGMNDQAIYQESTASNNFIDYVQFVQNYPESPYRSDAEDAIYKIYTKTGSLEAYKGFINEFPENRNISNAWNKMLNTYLEKEYSENSIRQFMNEFKDYPFKDKLAKELELSATLFFPFKSGNKFGFMDINGVDQIPAKFDAVEPFHEGLAMIFIDGKYGFINKRGEQVIDAIYEDAFHYQEGHAVVDWGGKWGMINRSGEFVILPEYEDLGNLTEGLSYFTKNENYGYFDSKGIVRLKAQYSSANDFSDGYAIVAYKGDYGVIDEFGTTQIPFKYERILHYKEDIYAVKLFNKWGLFSSTGDSITEIKYDFIGQMENNRALVELDDVFNYINIAGSEILEEWIPLYGESRQLASFTDGYARVLFEDGYNLIDTNGVKLFKKNKTEIGFYGTLIATKKEDKWGYLNDRGQMVLNYNYTAALSFDGDYAFAGGAPLWGMIDLKGNYVIEPYFEQLEWLKDDVLKVKSRGNYGLLSTQGDTLVPFAYSSIEPFDENRVQLINRSGIYYFDLEQKVFIRREE
jgi:hypothetical protein